MESWLWFQLACQYRELESWVSTHATPCQNRPSYICYFSANQFAVTNPPVDSHVYRRACWPYRFPPIDPCPFAQVPKSSSSVRLSKHSIFRQTLFSIHLLCPVRHQVGLAHYPLCLPACSSSWSIQFDSPNHWAFDGVSFGYLLSDQGPCRFNHCTRSPDFSRRGKQPVERRPAPL